MILKTKLSFLQELVAVLVKRSPELTTKQLLNHE